MRRLVVLAWVAACGPASKPAAPIQETVVVPPEPVLIESEIDPPYLTVQTPVLDEACATALAKPDPSAARAIAGKTKIYEFVPIPIAPVRYGPRIRDMPRGMQRPRNPSVLDLARWARGETFKACYRWARWAKHDVAGTMKVAVDLDAAGNIGAITVEDAATWDELGACVASVMTPAQARTFVPRPTRIDMSIDFTLSGQNPPRVRPARPVAVTRPALPAECRAAQASADAITYASPLGKIDDYDEMQARREEAEAKCKASGMKRCRISVVPIVRIGTAVPSGSVDKATIRAHVAYNAGAFGTCFADAADRKHAVASGEVAILAVITPDGSLPRVEIERSSTGDATLDECVRAAFAEIRFPAASGAGTTQLHIPFIADDRDIEIIPAPNARDTVETIEQTADAALQGGDTESALRRYAALAKHDPSCARQADLVRALHAAHPWIDDAVATAAADLVAMTPSGACATAATKALLPLAIQPHRSGMKLESAELIEVATERYRSMLAFAPEPDVIRAYLANALLALHPTAEAGALGVAPVEPKSAY